MAGFAEGSARAGSARGRRSEEGTSSWMTEPVEIPEKCCFKCKEGGDPLIDCNFKNCPKLYHPGCVGTEDDHFPDPGKQFICAPSTSGLEAYDKLFGGNLTADDAEALDELFLAVRPRRRKTTS